MRINEHVKEDMKKRERDWWRPEDKEYWKLWKEAQEHLCSRRQRTYLPIPDDCEVIDSLWSRGK